VIKQQVTAAIPVKPVKMLLVEVFTIRAVAQLAALSTAQATSRT